MANPPRVARGSVRVPQVVDAYAEIEEMPRRHSWRIRHIVSCSLRNRSSQVDVRVPATSRPGRTGEARDAYHRALTLVHDELENAPKTAESVSGGWMLVLSGLKTLLETGESLSG